MYIAHEIQLMIALNIFPYQNDIITDKILRIWLLGYVCMEKI